MTRPPDRDAPGQPGTPPAVLKFGGSSFRTPAAYLRVARALDARIAVDGRPLAVVVSAGPGETEQLRQRLLDVDPQPEDAVAAGTVTLADTVGAHLLAAALHRTGRDVRVLTGHESGLVTDSSFMWARIRRIDPGPLRAALAEHEVVVVPGGQAADAGGRPTWLGKNSSDLSAVALAVALEARRCEIHSDVDGIYSTDPHLVTGTRLLRRVSYDTASLMSLYGAKVLHRRAVRLAQRCQVEIVCRDNRPPFPEGTRIGTEGGSVAVVVLNQRSVALGYPDDTEADRAFAVFHGAGVDTVRLRDAPMVAVIGGYLDPERLQRRAGLRPGRFEGVPVAVIRGSGVTVRLAADEEDALHLAQRLHDRIEDTDALDASGAPTRAPRPQGV